MALSCFPLVAVWLLLLVAVRVWFLLLLVVRVRLLLLFAVRVWLLRLLAVSFGFSFWLPFALAFGCVAFGFSFWLPFAFGCRSRLAFLAVVVVGRF